MHQITFKKQAIKALRAMPPREAREFAISSPSWPRIPAVAMLMWLN